MNDSHPSNLHLCRPALGLERLPERMERKFFIAPERAGLVLGLLQRICRYDADFPQEQINSLYFDTPDLDQHERSCSGAYAKDKLRIRWYGAEFDPHRPAEVPRRPLENGVTGAAEGHERWVRVWLERKSRVGFASTKQREELVVGAVALQPRRLGRGIVPARVVVEAAARFGFFAPGPLVPVVAISYWRHRFVEPLSGFRVALDSHIRSTMVMPGVGRGERALELPGVIVEIKGPRYHLPPALRSLADFGTSWTRFSKYSSSLDAHAGDLGSVSRLWPSGVMVESDGCPVRLRRPRSVRAEELAPAGLEAAREPIFLTEG